MNELYTIGLSGWGALPLIFTLVFVALKEINTLFPGSGIHIRPAFLSALILVGSTASVFVIGTAIALHG